MELVLRLVDLYVVGTCAILVSRRYAGRVTRIVPADVLIWTIGVFFVLPLLLNVFGVKPNYSIYPGLAEARQNSLVRVLAAAGTFIAMFEAVRVALRSQSSERRVAPRTLRRGQRRALLVGALLPLFVVALSPNPGDYSTFAATFVLRGVGQPFSDPSSVAAQWSVFVAWSTYISCILFALWFVSKPRRSRLAWVTAGAVCYMNLWLNGKRHIVAMFIVVLLFALAGRHDLSRERIRRGAVAAVFAALLVLGISNWYQSTYRPHVVARGQELETFLIDFGRQDVLRLALAGHLDPEVERPVQWPGHSIRLHFDSMFGDEDVVTYADRVTSISYGELIQPQPGAITTSLISEAVDNFGIFGLLVGPVALGAVARLASYRNDPLLRIVGTLLVATLTVVHVLAVAPIVALMGVRVVWLWVRRRRILSPRVEHHHEVTAR